MVRRLSALVATLALALALPGLARAEPQAMWVVQAENGTLSGSSDRDLTLILEGVAPEVLLMRDRPLRASGHEPVGAMTARWRDLIAGQATATLAFRHPHSRRPAEIIVSLGRPSYDPVRQRLAFRAERIPVTADALPDASRKIRLHPLRTPERFGEASLFIASDPPPRHRDAMLWSLSGRSGAIVSEKGRLRLVIRGPQGRALRYLEQPARSANLVALEDLAQRWPHWFAKSAPNAALVAGSGKNRFARVAVLGRPTYDRATDTVSFPVRRLSGRAGGPRSFTRPVLYIDDVAGATVTTYGCTNAPQSVSIPVNTSRVPRMITIEAWGGQGGGSANWGPFTGFPGGRGGYAMTTIEQRAPKISLFSSSSAPTPIDLTVYVGCKGPLTSVSGGGGGSSAVLDASGKILVVAGGGGGASAGPPLDYAHLPVWRSRFNANGGSGGGDGGGLDGDPAGKPGQTWTTPAAKGGAADGTGGAGSPSQDGWGSGGRGGNIGAAGSPRTTNTNSTQCATKGVPTGMTYGYPWQWTFGGYGYGWGGASGFRGCGGFGSGGGGGAQTVAVSYGGGGGGGGYGGGGGGSQYGWSDYDLAGGGGGGGSFPASPKPSVIRTGDGMVVITIAPAG